MALRPAQEVRLTTSSDRPQPPWQLLAEQFELIRGGSESFARTYLDSFDWGIYRRSASLVQELTGGGQRVRLDTPEGWMAVQFSQQPRFARDFPPGPLQEFVASSTGNRTLLPIVRIKGSGNRVDLLDSRKKTVVRLWLEKRLAVTADGSVSTLLRRQIRVESVCGYGKAFRRAVAWLRSQGDWDAMEKGELLEALEALGKPPLPYSSKFELELAPNERADAAMKRVHRLLLSIIQANIEGVCSDLDPEFLHDFRVAVRRTRSALTLVKGVFPEAAVSRFRKEFSGLGKLTGSTRDLHVYLLKLEDYRRALPDSTEEELAPLGLFLENRQKARQRRLVRCLRAKRFRKLIKEWENFLGRPVPPNPRAFLAQQAIREVADACLTLAYQRVLKEGPKIRDDTPADILHRVRLKCKKLRHLLECFHSLYEPKGIGRFIKELRRLQENLGDFNDLQVQQATSRKWVAEIANQGTTASTVMATDRLLRHMERLEALERGRFTRRFTRFSSPRNQTLFRQLIRRY